MFEIQKDKLFFLLFFKYKFNKSSWYKIYCRVKNIRFVSWEFIFRLKQERTYNIFVINLHVTCYFTHINKGRIYIYGFI